METNLRLQNYLLSKLDSNQFSVRVWRDRYDKYMIVVGYYCFCSQKFDMRTRQIVLSESATGSMLEKANELRNIYFNKERMQYV